MYLARYEETHIIQCNCVKVASSLWEATLAVHAIVLSHQYQLYQLVIIVENNSEHVISQPSQYNDDTHGYVYNRCLPLR